MATAAYEDMGIPQDVLDYISTLNLPDLNAAPTANAPVATTPAATTSPPPAATPAPRTGPAVGQPTATSDLATVLTSVLGLSPAQLAVSSGQGRFGDWGATISADQAQALANQAGVDLSSSQMQPITVAGNPNVAGLTISPEIGFEASENGGYYNTGNYTVSYQPNYVGKATAIAQTKPDLDPTGLAISLFASAMGLPAWAAAGANSEIGRAHV